MERMQERLAMLEQRVQELAERQQRTERRLRFCRGLAAALLVVPFPATLHGGRSAVAAQLIYVPPVRRVVRVPTPGLAARVVALERAVNYHEQQIRTLGAALNQEVAARRVGENQLQQPAGTAHATDATTRTGARAFTAAQAATLRSLTGLLTVSGDTIRCQGDLALIGGHRLLANKISPVDTAANPDENGTTEFSGSVKVAKKLTSSDGAVTRPSP
jgi:hypothetical protein